MSENIPLLEFETEYPKLYEILVNGVPVYAALRDGVNVALNGDGSGDSGGNFGSVAGRVSIRRVLDSFVKLKRFKKAKTLIFTSSVYRRDKGRNLAAEYLMDKYPDAVVFEWPSRNEGFDYAYFGDKLKDKYCPLEWYLIKYKLYLLLHKSEYNRYCDECREKLKAIFPEDIQGLPENHQKAVEYIRSEMPDSYATTIISQNLFRKIFKNYLNVEYAIDFWGSARENIIPVLPGKPQSVELQHGIITAIHPGYIYPVFVRDLNLDFFKRTLLVYGNKTKELLVENSIFLPDKVEVIGNPRIIKYKQEFEVNNEDRNLILFTSQPFEQDGVSNNYYATVMPYLKTLQNYLDSNNITTGNSKINTLHIAVKLHPRESNQIAALYKRELPEIEMYGNDTDLFDILNKTYLHITVSSTTLFEAALFGAPTVLLNVIDNDPYTIYGFEVEQVNNQDDISHIINLFTEEEHYLDYKDYVYQKSLMYM